MPPSTSVSSDKSAPPSSNWVRFLRSYGPTPNNTTLFDEYVDRALHRAKVQPIKWPSPAVEQLQEHILSGKPGSILVAGTAGDGKTFHCRHLWLAIGGSQADWDDESLLKTVPLADGRSVVFAKDLSELTDEQSDHLLIDLERSVLGGNDSVSVVLAANHGQLLERFRHFEGRQQRQHPLRKPIQDAFLLYQPAPERLAIFDLSRTTNRNTLAEIVSAIAGHAEWDNCTTCSLQSEGRVCPISENRLRLLGSGTDHVFASRLGDLVEVARLNGWHLPVRDLLALTANIILGHRDAKEGLMACADVSDIQAKGTVERASLYANAFGANLPRRRAQDRPVFRALATFGIGDETTNGTDGLLVYGNDDTKLATAFEQWVANDRIYGATQAYLAEQKRYLEGEDAARLEEGASDFRDRLESQRRRLFFTLPQTNADYPYWSMTAFRFAGDYLRLMATLVERKRVDESTRTRIARGLNRVTTGLLIDNTHNIFVASSGGFTQSRVSVLCETEAPAQRNAGVGMAFKLDEKRARPVIEVALAQGDENPVALDLSPVRFEFLCRVADGALPGSFSNECLEDLLAFKAKLLRRAEMIRQQNGQVDDDFDSDEGVLILNFIEIEQSGMGFARPVTIRTPR